MKSLLSRYSQYVSSWSLDVGNRFSWKLPSNEINALAGFGVHPKHPGQRELSGSGSFNAAYVSSSSENQEDDREVEMPTLVPSSICISETASAVRSTSLIISSISAIVVVPEFFSTFTSEQKSVVKRAPPFVRTIASTSSQAEYTKRKRL